MRRLVPVAGLVAGAVVVVATPQPAGAAVVVSSAGTTITVSISGFEPNVSFACTGGKAVVSNGATTLTSSPAVTCAALTQVNVTGDSNTQVVDGSGLNSTLFTAKPKLNIGLGDGVDEVTETQNADTIDTGGGSDDLRLRRGLVANASLEMGNGTLDHVYLVGSDAADAMTVASTGANTTLTQSSSGFPASTWVVKNVEYADVDGAKGGDGLDATPVTIGSALQLVTLIGGDGNDVLSSGSRPSSLRGGTGSNTLNAGVNADQVQTESDTDVINGPTDGADDQVRDEDSLRFGGRTITGFGDSVSGVTDTFESASLDNDVSVRVRPASGGGAIMTYSLNRMGQQELPAGIEEMDIALYGMSVLTPRTLADVVVPAHDVKISSHEGERELIDITVPTGSWTDTAASGQRTIATSSAAVGDVRLFDGATYRVHGPWTNPNQGYGHRLYRDLLLRFATVAEREAVNTQLTNGTANRSEIVAGIMNTDEYRGVDVDRVFLRYLRRHVDPSGQTYWIGSLRNGKSLRQFRAQLFGSSEYFVKAGGTNAAFVRRAYEDVLGRKPDSSGQAYWTNKANAGTERGLIARQFLASAEAKRTIVRDQFLRFLDRQPTSYELANWTTSLDSVNGEQALVSALAWSAPYFART